MGWLPAGDGYEVALVDGRVAARAAGGRTAGRQLKTLPKALKDHPEIERLRRLAEWLDRHAAACLAQVDAWMVSSLPVPTGLLARVWADEAWQVALRDLVVVGDDPDRAGFLRDASDTGELRVVDLDGETVRLRPETVTLPHPVLLTDLDELREFAAELGVVQRVEQIHRATWMKPQMGAAAGAKPGAASPSGSGPGELAFDWAGTEVKQFAGAKFASRYGLAARAVSLGYRVSGGFATCRVRDGARTVEAGVWIGEPYWEDEVETGGLSWSGPDGHRLELREVGPVAWSEGMRMAAALHAGRVIEEGAKA